MLLIPGYGADEKALWTLRRYLGSLGYDARDWGLGRNLGNPQKSLPPVIEVVRELVAETVRPVKLVGWSLGGFIAREVARERPDLVEQVVTLGTPVVGGPRFTIFAGAYRRRGYDLEAIQSEIERRNATPIRVPVTAIVARHDGIVSPEACVDRSPGVDILEISTSHIGLLWSPAVYRAVARTLARGGELDQAARAAS